MEFNEFFSQNANEKKTLTDFQIKEGFGYLGSTPPSRMDFDYMFRRTDNNLYSVYNKYLTKASVKDSLNAVKLAYQKLDDDYQRVAGARQKIYDAETFYDTEYPTYQQQNATNAQNTGNYTTDIQNMTSAIQTLSQEIMDLVNRSYNNDISGLEAIPAKEAQLQTLIDQLNSLSPSDGELPGYLSKNKQVNVGDVFNIVGVPAIYKAFCSSGGTTGDNKLEIASDDIEDIEDGYTFTYGTASFILFASFLSIPVSGSIDILAGGNFRISQDGHLINPLTGSVMQHRKLMFFDKMQAEANYGINRADVKYNKNKNYLLKNGLSFSDVVDNIYEGSYSSNNYGFSSVNYMHTSYNDNNWLKLLPVHSHSISINTEMTEGTDGVSLHNHNMYRLGVSSNNTSKHDDETQFMYGDSNASASTFQTTLGATNDGHTHAVSFYTEYVGNKDYSTSLMRDNSTFLSPDKFPESVGLFFVVYA